MDVFGKCANPNGHGHNYILEVTITGPLNLDTFMVMDAATLKKVVTETVLNDLDHRDLNRDVPWLNECVPTVEAIVNLIWERLAPAIKKIEPSTSLFKLKLWETSTIYAERLA